MRGLAALMTAAVVLGWSAAEAQDAHIEPFGPEWSITENQPCQVWNGGNRAEEPYTWTGACIDGKVSGKGRLNAARDRYIYEGDMRAGKPHGFGALTLPGGFRYEGEWRDSMIHGRGSATYPDGSRYEGGFYDGLLHGRGTYFTVDGHSLEGEWVHGLLQGRTTVKRGDRITMICEMRDGLPVSETCVFH